MNMPVPGIAIFTLFLLAGIASASTPGQIDSCQTLDTPGGYLLTQNVSINGGTCFTIASNGVNLDGQGFTISGYGENLGRGVVVSSSNSTIKNLNIQSFNGGIILNSESRNNAFYGLTILSYGSYSGVQLQSSSENSFYNTRIMSNNPNGNGVVLFGSSNNNNFYNTSISLSSSGIIVFGSSNNNNFYNSALFSNLYFPVSFSSSGGNYLAYNNSFGEIKFTAKNLSISNSDILFPGAVSISSNLVYVNGGAVPELNTQANVTIRSLPSHLVNPQIYKNGAFCNSCYNFTSLNAGDVMFNVTGAGRYSINYSAIDNDVPMVQIVSPYDGSYFNSVFDINYTANDTTLNQCWYSLDGGDNNLSTGACSGLFSMSNLSEGTNTLTVYADDLFGNIGSATIDIIYDATAPQIDIFSPINGSSYASNNILINFSASDLNLDSLWYNNGTNNISYNESTIILLDNGNYNFVFYANDSAGNINSIRASFTVNVALGTSGSTFGGGGGNGAAVTTDTNATTNQTSNNLSANNQGNNTFTGANESSSTQPASSNGITGGVIGALGSLGFGGWSLIIAFVAVILVVYFAVRANIRKNAVARTV